MSVGMPQSSSQMVVEEIKLSPRSSAAGSEAPGEKRVNTWTPDPAAQWETAQEVLADMLAAGIEPDTVTFNCLIAACGNGAGWEPALKIFRDMQAAQLRPDQITYNSLITTCEQARIKPRLALRLRYLWLV
eukprot:gene34579-biopygen33756